MTFDLERAVEINVSQRYWFTRAAGVFIYALHILLNNAALCGIHKERWRGEGVAGLAPLQCQMPEKKIIFLKILKLFTIES